MNKTGRPPNSLATLAFNKKIGRCITTQRLLRGFNRKGIAKEISISGQQMAKYEQGQNGISLYTLNKFARIFKIPLVELISSFNISKDTSTVEIKTPKWRKLIYQLVREISDGKRDFR